MQGFELRKKWGIIPQSTSLDGWNIFGSVPFLTTQSLQNSFVSSTPESQGKQEGALERLEQESHTESYS